MRRPCVYTDLKKSPPENIEHPKKEGWLIQICVYGNATCYFVETLEGGIVRLHEAYTDLKFLPEEQPEQEQEPEQTTQRPQNGNIYDASVKRS